MQGKNERKEEPTIEEWKIDLEVLRKQPVDVPIRSSEAKRIPDR